MNKNTKKTFCSIAALCGLALLILLAGPSNQQKAMHRSAKEVQSYSSAWSQPSIGVDHSETILTKRNYIKDPNKRIATRIQRRLESDPNRTVPSIKKLTAAVKQRKQLLRSQVTVTFGTEETEQYATWETSTQKYPHWVKPTFTVREASFTINEDAVAKTFEEEGLLATLPKPERAYLHSVAWSEDEDAASRVEIEGTAREGYEPDIRDISKQVASALQRNANVLQIAIQKIPAHIINESGEKLGDLELWTTGLSDYTGSSYARKKNVRKALNEHVHNTIVAPGKTFSFNSTLGGPVSLGNGWSLAKVIFNGGDLKPAAGGGICQASTTVFRAVVQAGFPVVERRAHSLYVTYYKEHGVGIDATIYPGSQDLVFLNDSDSPLVIQAYHDGDEARVNLFGSPDGRTVKLAGPYFASNAPEGFTFKGRRISNKEIVWKQEVQYPNGTQKTYEIGSRYKQLPRYVAAEFTEPETVLHAAASEPQVLTASVSEQEVSE